MPTVSCVQCSMEYHVIPARVATTKFCSVKCRADWRAQNWLGEAHPRWLPGEQREKACEHCGTTIKASDTNIAAFRAKKFCSMECAKHGQHRLHGAEHPLFKVDSRRRKRPHKQASWSRAVIGRDQGVCQKCGVSGVEMHAHHVVPYEGADEAVRWDVANGITLCYECHWAEHTTSAANGVNSGNTVAGHAAGNPELSRGRKAAESATARGRACRRWYGECTWCGTSISKRFSDVKSEHRFCSRSCASKHLANVVRPEYRRQRAAMAVTSSKSAPAHQYGYDIA